MKIKVLTFTSGKKSYGTEEVGGQFNGDDPISEVTYEVDDDLGQAFLDNPTAYTVAENDDTLEIEEK